MAHAAEVVCQLKVPYLFIGGNALVALGVGAGTYDIDVGVQRQDFQTVAEKLEDLGWHVELRRPMSSGSGSG